MQKQQEKVKILATERLILRKFTLEDSDFIVELLNTEGWIKYIGDRNIRTTEQARVYLENGPLKSYQKNGFGLALVELKSEHIPIGMCGLIKRDYLDHPDIGFAFLPMYTGHGYAFEIAGKTIDYAFSNLGQEKLLAITLPTNRSSIKLLEKIGFRYSRTIITPDTKEELCMYSITKEDFKQKALT